MGMAHLMQGSVLVKTGDRVIVGQTLARVGNSGNTREPYLHIHAKCGGKPESMLDGEGVPIWFDGRWLIRNSLIRKAPATT
jgi:murein DD-endopeptidase MepM/ murein hydrolase activator NlpD